ncbi:hypothetical protein Vadar_018431 [Vaccinium darrowii]|uniref:Uncharacterized protein n=1 Tax=Vaccinium darrowii TaxID=229202 RepID=A0ACB7XID5_9ERIC|nr:hypothetical protein Vadar_018431 [Vaccinium darrowii]
MASITVEELRLFHTIDREIFSRLVIGLMRHPGESLMVMALWLWLETKKFPKIISKMVSQGDLVVNALANEASTCIQTLRSKAPPITLDGGMLLTATLMGRDISLQMIYQVKFTAIAEIKIFLNDLCAFIFTDILQEVLVTPPSSMIFPQSLPIPGFPHPLFGPITIMPLPLHQVLPPGAFSGWSDVIEVPVDDRTMFLTFSRGYPVSKEEVTELFTSEFGDCVEQVEMADLASPLEKPLYARMELRSVSTVDVMLNGKNVAKFKINGKHVWARKYDARRDST